MPDCKLIAPHLVLALIVSLVMPAVTFAGETTAPAPMVLVSDVEIGALEAALMAEVEKNLVRKCGRPVFSGKPLEGPADTKIAAIIEGGVHRACYQAMKKAGDAVTSYLEGPAGQGAEAPASVMAACLSLPVAIKAAVQHSDACSPYLFGRRANPELLPAVLGGRALAVLIRHEGSAGNWKGAIEMALNGLRFYQDLNRGPGASLMVAMVSTAAVTSIIDLGLRPLLEVGVPPDAEYKLAMRGVLSLLATDPPFCDCLGYERYGLPLQLLLPVIKGDGWEPPGGYDFGSGPPGEIPGAVRMGLARGQEEALAWVAMEGVHARFAEMCRTHDRVADLFRAMRAAADEIIAKPRISLWKRVLLLLAATDPQQVLRQWMVDVIQAVAIPSFDKYVVRYAQRRFMLQGLRLQLLASRYSSQNKVCPSLEGLKHPSFAPATIDPGSGKPMVITFPKNGTLHLTPAQDTVEAVADPEAVGSYQFRCPIQ